MGRRRWHQSGWAMEERERERERERETEDISLDGRERGSPKRKRERWKREPEKSQGGKIFSRLIWVAQDSFGATRLPR